MSSFLYENTKTKEFGVRLHAIRKKYANVSIPDGIQQVFEFRAYDRTPRPNQTWNTVVYEGAPVDGKQTWIIEEIPASIYQERIAIKKQLNTAHRDHLLRSCDWTQLPDIPTAQREAWAQYRAELRNLDMNDYLIIWPPKPELTYEQ